MYKFEYVYFKDIDLSDDFFDSLKADYNGFSSWFARKANNNEKAYVQTKNGEIQGFLYLKVENEPVLDVNPEILDTPILKIGTMKINSRGTRVGERFIKKTLDFAIFSGISKIYITVFNKHTALINLYLKYGFIQHGTKTSSSGEEIVLLKDLNTTNSNFSLNYPKISIDNSTSHILAIKPEYHTRLFPDSILNNEDPFDIIKDVSHTNSITKIYICKMSGVANIHPGDNLIIYRTSDYKGPAKYRSVATSVCVVDEVTSTNEFLTFNDLKNFCKNYSIFSEQELYNMYTSTTPSYIIKMTYNIALKKRIILNDLRQMGINSGYWGCFTISQQNLRDIIRKGEVNESYIID